MVAEAKVAGEPDQVTVPVYPVPAVVVLTGVAPMTGAVTPAIAGAEITVSVGAEGAGATGLGDGGGAGATGSGGGGDVAVVIDVEIAEASDEPATFIAVNENV